MTIHSLFRKGDLLHNHTTKEDGSEESIPKGWSHHVRSVGTEAG
jgi:hypothetical protein